MYPNFDGSGQDFNLDFRTWAWGVENLDVVLEVLAERVGIFRCSTYHKSVVYIYIFSLVVPLSYHVLKIYLSKRDLLLFQYIPMANFVGFF